MGSDGLTKKRVLGKQVVQAAPVNHEYPGGCTLIKKVTQVLNEYQY